MHAKVFGRAAPIALLLVVVAAFGLAGPAAAQEVSGPQTLRLTQSNGSGVSGTAMLTDAEGGVEVRLDVTGLPEDGVEHIAHIHEGASCADDRAGNGAPVKYPLESIVAGDSSGSSTTTIPNVTVAQLFDGSAERYLNVHAEMSGDGVPPGIACADVIPNHPGVTSGRLAETGGVQFAGVSLILALAAAGCGVLIWRHTA